MTRSISILPFVVAMVKRDKDPGPELKHGMSSIEGWGPSSTRSI